jgi:uncharacterized protein YndB with AHSA1/START domain
MATEYTITRTIDAPVERVWALLADVDEQARWNETLQSIEGDIREGGQVSLVAKRNPKRTFKLAVSDVRAPSHMAWSDGMPLGLFKALRTFDLAAEGDGTRFTMTETYSGPMAGLVTRSIPDMTDTFGVYADALQRAAEAG